MENERRQLSSLPQVAQAIREVAADSESGAIEILSRAVKVFSLLGDPEINRMIGSAEYAESIVRQACIALVRAQPLMAPLLNLVNRVLSQQKQATQEDVISSAAQAAEKFLSEATQAASDASSNAARLVENDVVILTHSRSSTVLDAFVKAKRAGKRFSVITTESRPMLEGHTLAEALAREAIRVTLIADAAAAAVMDQVNYVLVGADKITPNHLVNKIGTRMIALAASEYGLPVHAVCDTSKFLNTTQLAFSSDDEHSPGELWPEAPPGVNILNLYFESIPLSLVKGIITENGLMRPQQVSEYIDAMPVNKLLVDAINHIDGSHPR